MVHAVGVTKFKGTGPKGRVRMSGTTTETASCKRATGDQGSVRAAKSAELQAIAQCCRYSAGMLRLADDEVQDLDKRRSLRASNHGQARLLLQAAELADANAELMSEMLAALLQAKKVADEAREEWDKAPEGMKAGKLLIALSGGLPGYRKDIDEIHAAIAKAEGKP